MNNIELEATRRFLFLSVPEAARMVSETSEPAWRKWESAKNPVPDDVVHRLELMLEYREGLIEMFDEEIGILLDRDETGCLQTPLIWYDSVDDFLILSDFPVFWRPYCSAIAEMCAAYECVRIVKFDLKAYHDWLAGQDDSEQNRQEWAAQCNQQNT